MREGWVSRALEGRRRRARSPFSLLVLANCIDTSGGVAVALNVALCGSSRPVLVGSVMWAHRWAELLLGRRSRTLDLAPWVAASAHIGMAATVVARHFRPMHLCEWD